jgi:lipopolysaccharide transport system permease protein
MLASLRSFWLYRDFIFGSVKREFQSKYRNSLLGAAWTVINPLAMIVVYTVIFSQIMQAKLPGVNHGFAYGIYLCAGSLTWGLFAEIVGRGQNIFLDNANLIKKISFPRLSLPVIAAFNAGVNFAIIFGLFLIFLNVADLWPGLVVASAIPILLIQLIFAMGLGMTLGVLNVFFRDVGQFFGIFMQFWFWLTPVVYPADILPETIQSLMAWNPMYPLIHAYQDIFVRAQWPVWSTMIYPLVMGAALCILGLHLFREHVGEMVDEL